MECKAEFTIFADSRSAKCENSHIEMSLLPAFRNSRNLLIKLSVKKACFGASFVTKFNPCSPCIAITSRDRPKLAPYLELKNSKSTSKCQSFLFYSPEKPKSWTEMARQGGRFDSFHPFFHKS